MAQASIQQAMELAIEHQNAGRLREAEMIYRQVLAVDPNQPDALHQMGMLAYSCNQPALAIDLLGRAITIRPDMNNWNGLAIVLHKSRRLNEAIEAYKQALALVPDSADVCNNLGTAMWEAGQVEQGVAQLRRAIELRHNYPEAHNNLGNALQVAGKLDEAMACYQTALSQRPDYPSVYNNVGGIYRSRGQFDKAIESFTRAIALKPDYADAHNSLGVALLETGDVEKATAAHRHALTLAPQLAEAHQNLGMDLLLTGQFEQGWREYEWRWQTNEYNFARRKFAEPRWNGESLNGRLILLYAEQGFGDTIQFIRYLPQVAAAGGKIILACQKEVLRLMKQLHPIEQFVSEGDSVPGFDVYCPLLSLPMIFKTDLHNIPQNVPYLHADSTLSARWPRRLKEYADDLKVGLVWAGRPTHRRDLARSIPIKTLTRLSEMRGVKFFSLQKGEAAKQAGEFPGLIDYSAELSDFADSAALLDHLDLLIGVDTAPVHLAGAMGKPVWVLLPLIPDWRWMLDRADSPWYPSMRLFRQSSLGDWETVVTRVASELQKLRNQDDTKHE